MTDGADAAPPHGYRGYMAFRPGVGRSVPQSVQQLVMRDYCAARGLAYLLAATEYCMPGSRLMLEGVLRELDGLEGIVCFSMFSLPERRRHRDVVYRRVIDLGRTLHMAAERLVIRTSADAERIEDIWLVKDVVDAQRADDLDRLVRWDQHDAGDQLSRSLPEADRAQLPRARDRT
jgi:sporadic carbohydrate cluster protein (TIGR04323 family)